VPELPYKGARLQVVKDAKVRAERLATENVAKNRLVDAMKEREVIAIQSAIDACKSISFECSEIADGEALIKQIQAEDEVKSLLKDAISTQNKDKLKELLDKADELGELMQECTEYAQASKLLRRLEEEASAVSDLVNATGAAI
jgi:uncharacterized protein YjaG (DUF416 family)